MARLTVFDVRFVLGDGKLCAVGYCTTRNRDSIDPSPRKQMPDLFAAAAHKCALTLDNRLLATPLNAIM